MYKNSKRKKEAVAVAVERTPDPSSSQISGDGQAPTLSESVAAAVPEAKASSPVAGVRSLSAVVVATQAGPGRPPKRPRCVKCGRKLHLCRCQGGALLPKQVEAAVKAAEEAPKNKLTTAEAEQILRMALYCLGIAESAIAAVVSRMTWNEAQQVWSYDEKDVAVLLPPAAKVLAKYADKLPLLFTKYRDEMALAWAFMQVTQRKISASAELIAKKSASEAASQAAKKDHVESPHVNAGAQPGTASVEPSPASARVM